MKQLADVQKRLAAPFPSQEVGFKPQAYSRDRKRAMLLAYVDARAVMDRLDEVVPGEWSFEIEVIAGAAVPSVRGSLTIMGVTRQDIGEGDTLKAAASDALKRSAVHFGVSRYLYDLPQFWVAWDDAKNQAAELPQLPDWAKPASERTPGGSHIVAALEALRSDLPSDVEVQRELYRHLKAALEAAHPRSGRAA
ncbi:hypothetical protein HNR42_000127 [Deinobacterium chartae]|uniref:Uncharacterized protein n=1 Tax=Deinobacterium chartae TaxID=521158 RepID=A0A841HY44_9DEIO|nr:Rad52/Rad22 family DNA repair protein [Deinobacterium chartae]MBB6096715.1 hypothetical protein [Deinobacterium chartae]